MFTGIVEEIGTVKALKRGTKSIVLEIAATTVMEGTNIGDSIAVNGVCLTVTTITPNGFTADVMPETMSRTSLGQLTVGSEVNLERALTLQSRLGGHIVSGHIDGTGRVSRLVRDDNAIWVWIECDARIMRYIIEKGSITIQGISLTVAKTSPQPSPKGRGSFAVSLIPHTQSVTTLHSLKAGSLVNLENDVIAKYVERLMTTPEDESGKIDKYRNFFMH